MCSSDLLKVMYGPLEADINQKRLLYGHGERALLKATLAVLQHHEPGTTADGVKLHLGWPSQLIPQDPMEEASTYQVLIAMNLASRRQYLRERFPLLPDRVADGSEVWDDAPASLDQMEEEIDHETAERMALGASIAAKGVYETSVNDGGKLPPTSTQQTMGTVAAKAAGRARAGFGPEPRIPK